jgi:hypothetical protein
MDRASLEELNRHQLLEHALKLGVERAQVLTRHELMDEILRKTISDDEQQAAERGLLGRARDLLSNVVEQGLHRAMGQRFGDPGPIQDEDEDDEPAMATLTLAQIFVAQGHHDRALVILEEILASEPEHDAARQLRDRLIRETAVVGESSVLSESASSPEVVFPREQASVEPAIVDFGSPPGRGRVPMLDDEPLPESYGIDEAVVMAVNPTTAYVYWEVLATTVERLRTLHPQGRLVVRLMSSDGAWGIEGISYRDIFPEHLTNDYFVYGLPEGATLRVMLGWATNNDFIPLSISSHDRPIPWAVPAPLVADTVMVWTETQSHVWPSQAKPEPAGKSVSNTEAIQLLAASQAMHEDEQQFPAIRQNNFSKNIARLPQSTGSYVRWVPVTKFGSSEQWIEVIPVEVAWAPMGASEQMLP